MNFLHHSTLKKISAFIFMALYVFVIAVKTFHVHEFSYLKNSNGSQAATVSANFFCNICEFQLAKDADNETAYFHIETPITFLHTYYHFETVSIASAKKDFSVRGPPVMA